MKRKCDMNKGFTLIETVAAIGLLAVGLLSVLAVFSLGMNSTMRSGRYTEATIILQRLAEEEKLKGADNTATVLTDVSSSILPYQYQVVVYESSAGEWVHKRIDLFWQSGSNTESLSTDIFVFAF